MAERFHAEDAPERFQGARRSAWARGANHGYKAAQSFEEQQRIIKEVAERAFRDGVESIRLDIAALIERKEESIGEKNFDGLDGTLLVPEPPEHPEQESARIIRPGNIRILADRESLEESINAWRSTLPEEEGDIFAPRPGETREQRKKALFAAAYGASEVRAESQANEILSDALEYYAERQTTMQNPKGWEHVKHVVWQSVLAGRYDHLSNEVRDRAMDVLNRLIEREGRPDPVFHAGESVALRRRPEITGIITDVRWIEGVNGYPSLWGYTTSWGTAYPAHELVPANKNSEEED